MIMKRHVVRIGLPLLLLGIFPASMLRAGVEKTNSFSFEEDSTVIALGIGKDARTLPYHVQKIDGTELVKVKDANFVNSLVGRIAGATVNATSTGPGGSVRVMMRGLRSICGNNSVMYVVDGIPMPQLSTEPFYESYSCMGQSGDGVTAINPDDIENISVLTGAAASALYGSDGANGVILITTKKGQAGGFSVNVSNSTTFSSPFVTPESEYTYQKANGKLESARQWDPSDFFRTGHTITNAVNLSAGLKKNQTYFSAATQNSAGLVPSNDVDRYNMTFRNTSSLLNDRLKLDLNLMYAHIKENNMMSQGEYGNPLVPVYLIPEVMMDLGIPHPIRDLYARYNPNLGYNVQYWPYGDMGMGMQNPYWIINRNVFKNKKDRLQAGLGVSYDINSWLNASVRMRYDRDKENRSQVYADFTVGSGAPYLIVLENKLKTIQLYTDFLLNANKRLGDFSFSATLGASLKDTRYDSNIQHAISSVIASSGELTDPDQVFLAEKESIFDYHDLTKSVFLSAQIGYRNMLYLDLSGRMEWLNLWTQSDKGLSTDAFYPSVGVSVVPTEWGAVKSDVLSFMKIRYAYSEAGSSLRYFVPVNDNLSSGSTRRLITGDLEPERTRSHEIGLDVSLWKNKLNLAYTMYQTVTTDVLFFPISTPYPNDNKSDYGGRIDNKGIELTLGLNQYLGAVKWYSNLTYSINKNKIKEMWKSVNPMTGEEIVLNQLLITSAKGYQMQLRKDGSMGDIYVTTLRKDAQGNTLIDKEDKNVVPDDEYVYAGNANPDYTVGWVNNFAWKGIELSFVVQARVGGVGVSLTQAAMDQFGVSKDFADALRQGGVWVEGSQIPADKYYKVVGGYGVGSEYTYDATNIRLAEVSIGYNIPVNKWVKWMKGARVSLVGRNLLMLYNKAPFDPESTASIGTFYQGIDKFRHPSLRNMGFAVSLSF